MDDLSILRRIVPAYRNPPGPQLLGRTLDYTGRLSTSPRTRTPRRSRADAVLAGGPVATASASATTSARPSPWPTSTSRSSRDQGRSALHSRCSDHDGLDSSGRLRTHVVGLCGTTYARRHPRTTGYPSPCRPPGRRHRPDHRRGVLRSTGGETNILASPSEKRALRVGHLSVVYQDPGEGSTSRDRRRHVADRLTAAGERQLGRIRPAPRPAAAPDVPLERRDRSECWSTRPAESVDFRASCPPPPADGLQEAGMSMVRPVSSSERFQRRWAWSALRA